MAVDLASKPAEPTYGVRVNGKLFPHHLRKSQGVRSRPSEPPADAPPTAQDLVFDSIWRGLPFASTECVGKKELLKGYAASVTLLEQYHAELDNMFRSVCNINFTASHVGQLQQDAMQEEVKHILNAMYGNGDLKPLQVENEVDAHLLAKPTETVQQQLTSSLRRMTRALVTQAFHTLDRLTDRNVTGVIEWTSDTTCKFHFFTESLTQTYDGPSVETTRSSDIQGWDRVLTTRTAHRRSGMNIRVRNRHEHHLIEARKHAISDPNLEIPEKYRELVLAIPEWLRPAARCVSGTQIREDVVEQEKSRKGWLKEVVVTSTVRVHFDPAIVIDEYVLTGWGEQEIEADRRRKQRSVWEKLFEDSSRLRSTIYCIAAVAVLLQLAGLAFTVGGITRSLVCLLLGLTIAVFGLIPAGFSLGLDRRHRRGRELDSREFADIGLIVGSIAAGLLAAHLLCAAWLLGNWTVALIGVLAAMLSGITGTVFRQRIQ